MLVDKSGRVVHRPEAQLGDAPSPSVPMLPAGQAQHEVTAQQPSTLLGGAAKQDEDYVYIKVPRLPPRSAGSSASSLPAYMVRFGLLRPRE